MAGIDLLSLVIYLEPLTEGSPARSLPGWWGRAAMALLLDLARQSDPQLAEALHEENAPRPFTCSTLMGGPLKEGLVPGRRYWLRLTALQKELAGLLLAEAAEGALAPGKRIELDYLPFRICGVEAGAGAEGEAASPWARQSSYQELSAPYLLAVQPAPRRISLQFSSPTTFKGSGREFPFPLPELVFGSLLDKWNAFAPVAFPPEVRRYAAECLAASRYRLSTRPVRTQPEALHVGAVGVITYTTMNYDRYWMSVITTLAEFAQFAGVGAVTSMGMGQCRKVEE